MIMGARYKKIFTTIAPYFLSVVKRLQEPPKPLKRTLESQKIFSKKIYYVVDGSGM